jgi:hypothetical protein
MEPQQMEQIIGMLTKMEAKLEEAETNRKADREVLKEMAARMKTNQAELKSAIAQIESKKQDSVEMKPEAAHEDGARMPVGEPRKRCRDSLQETTGTDPEQGWVPEKFGCPAQRDDPPCKSGMAQEEHFK